MLGTDLGIAGRGHAGRPLRRALLLLSALALLAAACAGESNACASDGVAEFCLGPGGEIRGSGFEPGTTITASVTPGDEEFADEVDEDGWFPGKVAIPGDVPDEIVVEGTREDGEPVRIVLQDPET